MCLSCRCPREIQRLLNIELSEAASEDVTLTLTVVDGSAVESVDYEPLLVPVVIRAGVLELIDSYD